MKKIILSIAALVVLATCVFAGTKIVLNPYEVTLTQNDQTDVSVCISTIVHGVETPKVGVPLQVTNLAPAGSGFSVVVKTSPTAADGCGAVTLKTVNAINGKYDYVVDGMKGGNVIVGEEGSANTIPEFTTIGAGLALLGAGAVYFARKRK